MSSKTAKPTKTPKTPKISKHIFAFSCEACNHRNELQVAIKPKKNKEPREPREPRGAKEPKEPRGRPKNNSHSNNSSLNNPTSNNSNIQPSSSSSSSNTILNSITNIYPFPNVTYVNQITNFPIHIEIKHQGFWISDESGKHMSTTDQNCDRNSVMFTPDSLLYVYKLALRHMLLSMNVLAPRSIDPQNLVPHMVVRRNKSDPYSNYHNVQNKKYIITEDMITVKNDFMTVEIDSDEDLHCTLVYSKRIKEKIDLLKAFRTVVSILNEYPHLMEQYSSLPYFGQEAINYWYNTPSSFPFEIIPPEGYTATKVESVSLPVTTTTDSNL